MKIILKHILKNIWEKKGRSLLILLSLMIATTVFVLNLTLPDEIILKVQETLRTVYGNADVSIKTVEPFSIDDLKIANENMNLFYIIVGLAAALGVAFIATGIIESFMQGLAMYVEMVFNWKTALEFVGIIFIILLLTLIIPSRRLKKMNVVNAIKYE